MLLNDLGYIVFKEFCICIYFAANILELIYVLKVIRFLFQTVLCKANFLFLFNLVFLLPVLVHFEGIARFQCTLLR